MSRSAGQGGRLLETPADEDDMSDIIWCYATDSFGDNWNECDTASTREEAIAEAVEYAKARGFSPAHIGQKVSYTHADLVRGLGGDVRELLTNRATDEVSDHAREYPDMKSEPFDEALEAFVLDWLNKNADRPRFFTVDDEESIDVDDEEASVV